MVMLGEVSTSRVHDPRIGESTIAIPWVLSADNASSAGHSCHVNFMTFGRSNARCTHTSVKKTRISTFSLHRPFYRKVRAVLSWTA